MNKNTKILLIVSIVVFILAIGIFAVLTLSSKDSSTINTTETTQKEPEEFIFTDSEGNELKINEESELGLAIIFWSSDTENSLETLELIGKYYETYKDIIDFYIINTSEKNEDIIEIVNNCEFTFPVYYDINNKASDFYSIDALPTLVFITKEDELHTLNNGIDEDTLTANLDILAENY